MCLVVVEGKRTGVIRNRIGILISGTQHLFWIIENRIVEIAIDRILRISVRIKGNQNSKKMDHTDKPISLNLTKYPVKPIGTIFTDISSFLSQN